MAPSARQKSPPGFAAQNPLGAPGAPDTRRGFLYALGKIGGAGAVYDDMVALGLLQVPGAWAGPPKLADGHGKSVLILGAGMAGMAAADEL